MALNTKGKIFLTSFLVLATSIGAWAGISSYNNSKARKEEEKKKEEEDKNNSANQDSGGLGSGAGSGAGTGSGGGGGYVSASNPFNTSAELKAFQTWANTQGASLITDGVWGSKSAAAWKKYGSGYKSTPSSTSIKPGDKLYVPKMGLTLYSYPNSDRQYGMMYISLKEFRDSPYARYSSDTGTGWSKIVFMPTWNKAGELVLTTAMKNYVKKYPNGVAAYIKNSDKKTTQF